MKEKPINQANEVAKKTRKAKKAKKVKKEHPKLKMFLRVSFVFLSIVLICATVAVTYVYNFSTEYINGKKKVDLDVYKANQAQTSIIYAYDSNKELVELLRLHGAENRVWIEYDDIPKEMIDAFRDLEDKRFEEHQGVDWYGTVLGVVGSGFERGASTITQQLIKNITKENGRTVSRKFYEILNALNVERFYHKKTIMEFYLNTIYLGNGCYGIKTAAEIYFGKNVEDLNAAECATIASITKAPATFDPLTKDGLAALLEKDEEGNMGRQRYCLTCMLENGSLTQKEYEEALDYELVFTNSENYKGSQVTDDTEEEDDKEYTEEDVKVSGTENDGKSSYYVEYVIDQVIEDLMAKYDITYNDAWRKVFFGGLRIYTAVDLDVQKKAEDVFINRKTMPDVEDTEENPAPQAAMTIMDYNGRVIAMVGGAGKKESFRGLNRACNSPRQPGSSIKPLSVYAPAVEANFVTWSTMVQNYGIRMGSSRWPINYGGNPGSPSSFVTVQYALQQSLNTVPAQIVRQLGISPCFDFLVEDLHFSHLVTDEEDPNYDGNYSSVCVGGMSEGVTTLEMTAAYAIFGNNGYYYKPYSYYKVTNNDGTETLLSAGDSEGEQVISERTAGVMRELLETVSTRGTGSGYGVKGFTNFSKTGTTTDEYDRWYVGGTPYYVAACWYGYDIPESIDNSSGNPAGKLYREVMNAAHEGLDDLSFPSASGVVSRSFCTISGDIASKTCANTSYGYYKSNDIPGTCKNCAIRNGIGQGIPDVIPNTATTTEESTTKKPKPSTTKPKTTKPKTTAGAEKPSTTQPKTTKPTTTKAPETTKPTTTQPTTTQPPQTTQKPTSAPVVEQHAQPENVSAQVAAAMRNMWF